MNGVSIIGEFDWSTAGFLNNNPFLIGFVRKVDDTRATMPPQSTTYSVLDELIPNKHAPFCPYWSGKATIHDRNRLRKVLHPTCPLARFRTQRSFLSILCPERQLAHIGTSCPVQLHRLLSRENASKPDCWAIFAVVA